MSLTRRLLRFSISLSAAQLAQITDAFKRSLSNHFRDRHEKGDRPLTQNRDRLKWPGCNGAIAPTSPKH
ncbi:MAG: hypothetical protein ACFBSG_06890 [Leptolyngbyaceae cyanobacterium]